MDVIQTAISSQIGLAIIKVGAVRQSSQFDGCGPVGIQQLAYLPPTFWAFVGWKPFRSVRTIAELIIIIIYSYGIRKTRLFSTSVITLESLQSKMYNTFKKLLKSQLGQKKLKKLKNKISTLLNGF